MCWPGADRSGSSGMRPRFDDRPGRPAGHGAAIGFGLVGWRRWRAGDVVFVVDGSTFAWAELSGSGGENMFDNSMVLELL